MENLSFKASEELASRIEEYRRSQDPVPDKSKVIRDALDEFLPELEDGDRDGEDDAPQVETQVAGEEVEA